MYRKYIKRIFDFIFSFFALAVLSPLLLFLAVIVKLKLGSPVIFKQERPGRIDKNTGSEKIFTLYKFRTMTDERNDKGELLSDTERLTKFGKFLRSTSLDELPELINILKGDMAIVGPRPLAVQYLPYYNETERIRHTVLPGLTGYAQVCGRNTANWEDRFSHDIEYVEKISFVMDVKVIGCTVVSVLKRSDIGVRGVDSPMDFDEYRRRQLESTAEQHSDKNELIAAGVVPENSEI